MSLSTMGNFVTGRFVFRTDLSIPFNLSTSLLQSYVEILIVFGTALPDRAFLSDIFAFATSILAYKSSSYNFLAFFEGPQEKTALLNFEL